MTKKIDDRKKLMTKKKLSFLIPSQDMSHVNTHKNIDELKKKWNNKKEMKNK
jgi:hypothetical protein